MNAISPNLNSYSTDSGRNWNHTEEEREVEVIELTGFRSIGEGRRFYGNQNRKSLALGSVYFAVLFLSPSSPIWCQN